jgi:acyl-CoA synthetase (AMP-forming)/AMP-acid ligase II
MEPKAAVLDLPRVRTLDQMARDNRAAFPDRPALIFKGEAVSFAELDRRANRVANRLAAEGLAKGDRIALLCKNNVAWFELLLGAVKAGVVLVPVNFRLAPREVAFIVNDATSRLFFVDTWFAEVAREIGDGLDTVEQTILIGDADGGGWPDYADWRDAAPDTDPMRPVAPDDDLIQMYTSGTTGLPKGAVLTHANTFTMQSSGLFEWDPGDLNLVVMPLFHIAGSAWALSPMIAGVASIVMEDVDPGEILCHVARDRVTKMLLVPAVILFVLQHPDCAATDFSSLNLVTYGASPIPFDVLQRAMATMRCDFMHLYGMTEATGAVTYLPAADHRLDGSERTRSVGIQLPRTEVRVVDPDGNDTAPREIGEIVIRGPLVMKGYWNRPEATAAAIRDGWYHSGDAGWRDEDGYIYVEDRIKDMVITGGENVYPAEVENCLAEHPGVADVGVIGVADPTWGEVVRACVVPADDATVTEQELIDFARARIAHFKCPRSVVFVDALPRNPSGKILKRALREMYGD